MFMKKEERELILPNIIELVEGIRKPQYTRSKYKALKELAAGKNIEYQTISELCDEHIKGNGTYEKIKKAVNERFKQENGIDNMLKIPVEKGIFCCAKDCPHPTYDNGKYYRIHCCHMALDHELGITYFAHLCHAENMKGKDPKYKTTIKKNSKIYLVVGTELEIHINLEKEDAVKDDYAQERAKMILTAADDLNAYVSSKKTFQKNMTNRDYAEGIVFGSLVTSQSYAFPCNRKGMDLQHFKLLFEKLGIPEGDKLLDEIVKDEKFVVKNDKLYLNAGYAYVVRGDLETVLWDPYL